ncbi:reverse transcriptase domain-containing protein [Tanacetum coccineum]
MVKRFIMEQRKLEEISITTVNAECSAIILNIFPEKLEDPGKFLIPCALQELDRTNALADSGASINLLPHSIYKQLGLGALKPTRMTLELANRTVTHPMGIAEDVVVRVDGFTFLADFVVVNFEPDPRVPIILGRHFLRTAKALIDLYEEKLTLRVGNDELVFYADKSEKNKNKQFAHAISIIDFLKDEPFSGSTTIHSNALLPSSSPVKTSDNLLEEFADEFTLPYPFPPGNDDSILNKDVQKEDFRIHSNSLFGFEDNFNSNNENPLFNEMEEDVENENSKVFDEPVLPHIPFSDKVKCFDLGNDINEIEVFLAMEISNYEEGYYDSEGDVLYLKSLLCDDITHNPSPEISNSRSPENFHASPSTIIESLPTFPNPVQEEIDLFPCLEDLIPPGVENDDSEDEDNSTFFPKNESSILDPSFPRPPPEPPDVCLNFEPVTAEKKNFGVLNKDDCFNPGRSVSDVLSPNVEDIDSFTFVIWTFLPCLTYSKDSPLILSFGNEDLVFDPVIST